jgi:3-oxoacyl-[acyl-carrier protein] reductase
MAASRSVEGLKALVTGAGSGMGAATARLLAEDGALVAVTDVNLASAEAVAAEIGARARAFRLDVGDAQNVVDTLAEIVAWAGGLDILVNNAGIAGFLPIDHEDYEQLWERIVRVNATGEMRVIRAALAHLRRSAHPRIVNIASTEALGATALDSAYCAAKSAVTGLTRALAVELGKEGITVNCICPGPIDTGMTADVPDGDKALYAKRRTALRRYGRPEEVAHMTVSLCQPGASFITGATIPVDGGLMARNA